MASMQDRSVLFSLKLLQTLEENRAREESEAVRARIAAEKRAAQEAEMRIADALSAERRIEAERKARILAEKRADEACSEAIRIAAVERARADAEVKARVEAMRIAEEHKRALMALRHDKHGEQLRRIVVSGVIVASAMVLVGLGFYFGKLRPEAEARIAAQQAEIARADAETKRLRAKLAARETHIAAAERVLRENHGSQAEAAKGTETGGDKPK